MMAVIPARAGSKRVPGKNTRLLYGKPLYLHTVEVAQVCGVFDRVVVATDDPAIEGVPWDGRTFLYRRPPVPDTQPDIDWLRELLQSHQYDETLAILRPTSPFRTVDGLKRAYALFAPHPAGHSLRAVRPVTHTPYKMWRMNTRGQIVPVLGGQHSDGTPYHSSPTQSLPVVYEQTSSLEMAWASNITTLGTIHGHTVWPYVVDRREGFSIDTEADWIEAVQMMETVGVC